MKKVHATAMLLAALALSACNSSGTDGSVFQSMIDGAEDIHSRIGNLPQTEEDEMPIEGNAIYEGYATFWSVDNLDDENAYAMSRVSLIANFEESLLTGSLHEFVAADDTAIGGEMSLLGGTINANGVSASLEGSLSIGGESSAFDGFMEGYFVGENQQGLMGGVGIGNDDMSFGGGWLAERQP